MKNARAKQVGVINVNLDEGKAGFSREVVFELGLEIWKEIDQALRPACALQAEGAARAKKWCDKSAWLVFKNGLTKPQGA